MAEFTYETALPHSASEVYAWHARPGAFQRLAPPWQPMTLLEQSGGIADGARTVFDLHMGPLRIRWEARHEGHVPQREFTDVQVRGPFRRWRHTHRFLPRGDHACVLQDHVDYEAPWGLDGLMSGRLRGMLERLFRFRHQRTRADLQRHARYGSAVSQRIAMAGGSGLIGAALRAFLLGGGHSVAQLVRRKSAGPEQIAWDPEQARLSAAELEGFDAIIHLGGENIAAGRWSAARKATLRRSRVNSTRVLAEAIAGLQRPPRVFLCASAVGYYGARVDETVTEESAAGRGFLPELCQEWEAACAPAAAAGVRVVHLRTGIVLAAQGGALKSMLLPFRVGVGGVIGAGDQPMSWIALDDVIGLAQAALFNDAIRGAFNATAPFAVSNREFTKTLGSVLRRPTALPIPAFLIRAALGEMGDALLLGGQRVVPRKALDSGVEFLYPRLEEALRGELGLA